MVKGALFKKSIRDMKKSLPQFVSIFVMAAVAVCIVVGLDSIWKTVQVNSAHMYDATNLADIWVYVQNPSDKDIWAIKNIKGVSTAEKRLMMNVSTDLKGDPTLRLYTMADKSTLDLPYLIDGNPITKGGAVLDENFAEANNLKPGDKIKIKVNDRWISLKIEALALSSEHIFSIKDSTTAAPNSNKYGFIIVNEDKIKSAYGGNKVYNQIEVKLEKDVDAASVSSDIDTILGDKLVGITTGKDNVSTSNVITRVQQFRTLSTIFPIMFFIVTALVTLSTMSRIVEDQRNQIGVLKALGYSTKDIIWHYTSYGLHVGILGSVVGTVLGPNIIARILIKQMKFLLKFDTYELSLYKPNIIMGSILIILCTAGVSCYSCLKLQEDMPAVLLRDKPPENGSHIFLEKIPSIWDNMKFSQKLISRNTLRNKGRMVMSIIGVMGCTGLIIGAFTLNNMVRGIGDKLYGEVYSYDDKIVLDDKTSEKDIDDLHLNGTADDIEETVIQIVTNKGNRRMANVTIRSPKSQLFVLRDMKGNEVLLPKDGVVITRKLAEILHLSKGDKIRIKLVDNRFDDRFVETEIKDIVYMVSRQGVYISKECWDGLGEDYKPSFLLIKWNKVDKDFLTSDYVDSFVLRSNQKSEFESNLKIIYTAAAMLIISGGILAFVVLYNLGVLNFFERTRDLATFKVLGFYESEIRSLVLIENILSAVAGGIAGIPVGKIISDVIASGFGDDLDLISHVSIINVLMAEGLTLLFAATVNRIVVKKIETIDMLQALKSVE